MGLDFINKISEKKGKKSSSHLLKINKYEDAQMALKLIGHICTKARSLDISSNFKKYDELIDKLEADLEGYSLLNSDFTDNLRVVWRLMEEDLIKSTNSSLNIVVAGGFSAGKSSLLNKFTKFEELLPTGVEPVSVVNTCLNCSSNVQELIVKGENLKGDLVLLNEEVLACIQHSSKSKTYIAPILKRIIIDIPSEQYLDGITFVDTPGYNNALNMSDSDRHKAIEALKEGDAILWCVDIECGTLTKNDLEILKQFKNKPIVILFTKMDKKSESEVKKIVDDTAKICMKEFGHDSSLLDIMALSCLKDTVYSRNNYSFQKLIQLIKSKSRNKNVGDYYKDLTLNLFGEEIQASYDHLRELEDSRIEKVKEKGKKNKIINELRQNYNDLKTDLHEVIIKEYDKICDCAVARADCFEEVYGYWAEALKREGEWAGKSGIFSSIDDLMRRSENHIKLLKSDRYDYEKNKRLCLQYSENLDRKRLYDIVSEELDRLMSSYDDIYEDVNNEYNQIIEKKKSEESLIKILQEYEIKCMNLLKDAYAKSIQDINTYNMSLQRIKTVENEDVFSAISGDSYDRFLSCFSEGVDLNICNNEGFSPITWAVYLGNNEMIKFFIKHDADMSAKDKRGYNALETAAICHYKDICELLIETDRSLIYESRPLAQLASQNNHFIDWVSKLK